MSRVDLVYSGQEEIRLDHYLVTQFPDRSRSQIQRMVKDQLVTVNEEIARSSYKLQINDRIAIVQIDRPAEITHIEPEKISLNIVFEDDEIIVINKPAGLLVHPGTGQSTGTLVHGLAYHCKDLSNINGAIRPGIIHRLDQETSGIMVAAKTNRAHKHIADQFQKRSVEKKYIGITWGEWNEKDGVIDQSLKRSRKDATSYVVDENGRTASTHYKVIKEFRYMSHVEFYPKTGRTHQIRVHASAMNHPIVHDMKYNGGENRLKGFLPEVKRDLLQLLKLLGRHALHAHHLSFQHPSSGKKMNFEAEIPGDIQQLMDHLTENYG